MTLRHLIISVIALKLSLTSALCQILLDIPDSLKGNAHYILKEFSTVFEMKSPNSGVEKVRKEILILDREGEKDAYLVVSYDRYSKVSIDQITIYDANGKKVKSVKQSDIEDYPAYGPYELYSEERMKYYKPEFPEVPYLIDYEYEINQDNLISLGRWMPANDFNLSVLNATYTLIHPLDVKINSKESGLKRVSSVNDGRRITEKWEIKNFMAIEEEPFGPPISDRVPVLYLMPSQLIYDKHSGSSNTWKDYGLWAWNLYEGRDLLPEDAKDRILKVLSSLSDTVEMIRTLYKYLQENSRYVSITLDVGGYQPFDVATVIKTSYGDCKALTNYMFSMLKFAGIKSYPALVSAGNNRSEVFSDFPNFSQFNHVILCVPRNMDTLWLECTDQKIPFGFLGSFTDNRNVLLLSGFGGRFARTPRYSGDNNIRSCRSDLIIDSTGKAVITTETLYSGLQYYDMMAFLRSDYDEQKKWLYSNISLPSLQIRNFSVSESRSRIPLAKLFAAATSENYCSFSGTYMVLPLNLINVQKPVPKMVRTRQSDIIIRDEFIDVDTIVFHLPQNLSPLSLPKEFSLTTKFGKYVFSVSQDREKLVCTRRYEVKAGRYSPLEYKEFYDFILSVSKTDNSKILLTRKN